MGGPLNQILTMLYIFLYLAVVIGMFAWGRHLVIQATAKRDDEGTPT